MQPGNDPYFSLQDPSVWIAPSAFYAFDRWEGKRIHEAQIEVEAEELDVPTLVAFSKFVSSGELPQCASDTYHWV